MQQNHVQSVVSSLKENGCIIFPLTFVDDPKNPHHQIVVGMAKTDEKTQLEINHPYVDLWIEPTESVMRGLLEGVAYLDGKQRVIDELPDEILAFLKDRVSKFPTNCPVEQPSLYDDYPIDYGQPVMPPDTSQNSMTNIEFFNLLDRHDWYACYSDSPEVMKQHDEESARIQGILNAANDAEFNQLYNGFRSHYFSGESWGNAQQPKPVAPEIERKLFF